MGCCCNRSIPKNNTKYLDLSFCPNPVSMCCGGFVCLLVELDHVTSFEALAVHKCEPVLRKNWFLVPSFANGAFEGPNLATFIDSLKIYSMSTVEGWKRAERPGWHCESLSDICLAKFLWELCHQSVNKPSVSLRVDSNFGLCTGEMVIYLYVLQMAQCSLNLLISCDCTRESDRTVRVFVCGMAFY